MDFEKKYSDYWKNLGSILIYQSKNFIFNRDVIITELDNCLIKKISPFKLYDTLNTYDIELFSDDFIKKLHKDYINGKSIVILSNQINQNKLNVDMIKMKLESILEDIKFPILCFFALTPNNFMKPHTGMWKLLLAFYSQYGGNTINIKNTVLISNAGGILIETKKDYKIKQSDDDRAFAWNIGIEYKSIDEYLETKKAIKFRWDSDIISPEIRELYCEEIEKLNKNKVINVFKELSSFGKRDTYIIIMLGAPRSGKTMYAKQIVEKWRASAFGKKNVIRRLDSADYTKSQRLKLFKKHTMNRISVILDGECYLEGLRKEYVDYAKENNFPILYINVDPGLEMSKLFNHVCVEEAKDEKIVLYKSRLYNIYRSYFKEPKVDGLNTKLVNVHPVIEKRTALMHYRY